MIVRRKYLRFPTKKNFFNSNKGNVIKKKKLKFCLKTSYVLFRGGCKKLKNEINHSFNAEKCGIFLREWAKKNGLAIQ